MPHINPLEAFGRWIAEVPRAWPSEACEAARLQHIDVLGVAVAGAVEEVAAIVAATVADWGAGPCTVIGSDRRLSAPWAALVNGTAAHALDFDDNFDPAKAHASAVLVPAILALAEERGASGMDLIDAYIVGLQIMGRIGQGLNPYHRNRGWHATATVGAIGAAAGCSRLMGLDAMQAAHALSLATSMASGSMAQFGAMAKPLHAGLAAKAGVIAASFADAGLTAGAHTLDGPYGINRLMVGPDYEALRDGLGPIEHGQTMRFETDDIGEPLQIVFHGFRVKRFANCGSAHRAMDGLLHLRESDGFTATDVAQVMVTAPISHLNNLRYTDPETALEAKFSLEFALALILLTGNCRLTDFTDDRAADPTVRSLYSRIVRDPVDASESVFPTRIEVRLRNGKRLTATVEVPYGSRTMPFEEDAYWSKFAECLEYAGASDASDGLKAELSHLTQLPSIDALTRWLGRHRPDRRRASAPSRGSLSAHANTADTP